MSHQQTSWGPLAGPVGDRIQALQSEGWQTRLQARETSLWTEDPAVAERITNRLGWVDLPQRMKAEVEELLAFAQAIHESPVRNVLVVGMGGSSLFPHVLSNLSNGASDSPVEFSVLSSTEPETVRPIVDWVVPNETLVIIASKSGTTLETLTLYDLLSDRLEPSDFVAITDPGSPLEGLALKRGFKTVFHHPIDVGGRFSAMSVVGLLPAALLGMDLQAMLESAADPRAFEVGLELGAFLAEAALAGRDKMTLRFPTSVSGLTAWIEQLVAESTGKSGKGIIPITDTGEHEPPGTSDDQVYILACTGPDDHDEVEQQAQALAAAGIPTHSLHKMAPEFIGRQVMTWEIATAVAGAILGVNPFDEPDVQSAKERATDLLKSGKSRVFSEEPSLSVDWGVDIYAEPTFAEGQASEDPQDWINAFLDLTKPGDYLAILAFLPKSDEVGAALQDMGNSLRNRTGLPVTVAFGPEYLHSTGQLHKGGPNSGAFFVLSQTPATDVPIPGKGYGFYTLCRAQVTGDLKALWAADRRAIRFHFRDGAERGLNQLIPLMG